MEVPLSPSPTSDDEPMPQAPLADDGWRQSDGGWLGPIAEGPGDVAQAAAEEREGTRDAPLWHSQHLEENPIEVKAQDDGVDEDPLIN